MIKIYKYFLFLFLITGLLTSCQTVREGLEGKKKSKNAEEFLIDKKNPLVLPPDFSLLPVPETRDQSNNTENEFNLEKILSENPNVDKDSKVKSSNSIEKSILEKINKE